MKNKIFLPIILFYLLAFVFVPFFANAGPCPASGDPGATGLVPCGVTCSCTISNFFTLIGRIYKFIVWQLATPLAILAFLVGGIIMMVSAGNPGLAGRGRSILMMATIGLVLVFCSWLIVNVILMALTGKGLN